METVFGSLNEHALRQPDKIAVIGQDQSLTYRHLCSRVQAATQGILESRVAPGDRVAIASSNGCDHLVGILSAMAAGAIAVPLPNQDPTGLGEVLDDCDPALVVATRSDTGETLNTEGRQTVWLADLENGRGPATGTVLERTPRADDIAMIYYTSGTTGGIRKGVMQSYATLRDTAIYIADVMQMTSEIREFVATPTDNAFWFGRCRTILRVGGTMVINDGPLAPRKIVRMVTAHNCNAIAGDTPIFMMLTKHMQGQLSQFGPAILWAKTASQAMPIEAKRALVDYLPNARLVMNYGLTEAMRCCLLPMHDHPAKLESVGRPCPGVRVRVTGVGGGTVEVGEAGEIQVQGVNLASGYWRREQMWQDRFDDDWFRTGDLGRMCEAGFVSIEGRIDDAINVGGKTIAPVTIEDLLLPYLPRSTYAVCGIDDASGVLGEIAALCVAGTWAESVHWRDIRADLLKKHPTSLVPRAAFVLSELPTTQNGKVRRQALRKEIAEGRCTSL